MNSTRLWAIQTAFVIWASLLFLRLSYWQILKSSSLRLKAQSQQTASILLSASRGLILARDGFPLVGNKENFQLIVNPQSLPSDLSHITRLLAHQADYAESLALLSQAADSPLSWLVISRSISPELKKIISSAKIPGVSFESVPVRFYPEGTTSAQLTGFVGQDAQGKAQGYFGLEGYYDRQLSGIPGRLLSEKDALGLPILIGSTSRIPPREGASLLTSIDRTVQYIAAKSLSDGLAQYQAVSGTVTVLDSKTGQVLALTSLPGYDPTRYQETDESLFKSPAISEGYEPGSTFKALVMAAALDAGILTPDTICPICTGPVVIADNAVHNWDDKYYPGSTMTDVILHSDNVGMTWVSRRLGRKKLLEYLTRFGLGRPTGVDLQEESVPPLRPDSQWYDIDLATAAFGQGIAVTPLQMTAAVNILASGGQYLPPRVAMAVDSHDRMSSSKPLPQPKGVQVISRQTANVITQILVHAVDTGQVRYYKPDGYVVAGKTGTAQVPIEGHYDKDMSIASFVGFAPADNPKFTMLVTLRDPKTSPWGSTTAAPLWFSIAQELFRYYRIAPYNHLTP